MGAYMVEVHYVMGNVNETKYNKVRCNNIVANVSRARFALLFIMFCFLRVPCQTMEFYACLIQPVVMYLHKVMWVDDFSFPFIVLAYRTLINFLCANHTCAGTRKQFSFVDTKYNVKFQYRPKIMINRLKTFMYALFINHVIIWFVDNI